MIVRESDEHYVMTTQHDHAAFASQIAAGFADSVFQHVNHQNDVICAIEQHDRGWIRLDETPIWNDRANIPFSFTDYPMLPKLVFYKMGIDEVEQMNAYAALLCSRHYSSFKHIRNSSNEHCVSFLKYEQERQQRIISKYQAADETFIAKHLMLLQLCDEISLYVCMNRPGASKEEEHPWYKDGFETMLNNQKSAAQWVSEKEIKVDSPLFCSNLTVAFRSKHVPKKLVRQMGIAKAFQRTDWTEQMVHFKRGAV